MRLRAPLRGLGAPGPALGPRASASSAPSPRSRAPSLRSRTSPGIPSMPRAPEQRPRQLRALQAHRVPERG
eukprot:4182528-Alexandrium_andersonii.AAC.1